MISDIRPVLKQLGIQDTGKYEDQFYVITLDDSDDYSRMYTKLDKNAVNTENPQFGVNDSNVTTNISHYFETTVDNVVFDIFLLADFDKDEYLVKIKEREVE